MKFITFGRPSLYPGELKEITSTLKSSFEMGPKVINLKNFSIIQNPNIAWLKFLHGSYLPNS